MKTYLTLNVKLLKHIFLSLMVMMAIGAFGQTGGADFEVGPLMNSAKIVPMTTVLDDGRVATFGGREYGFVSGLTAEFYDYEDNAFTAVTMGVPRDMCALVKLANGKYLIVGGGYDWGIPAYATNEIFNPDDNSFSNGGTMIYPRMMVGGIQMSNGEVLIAGGWYNDAAAGNAEVYNYNDNTYSITTALNVPRAQPLVLPAGDGAIVCGGWPAYGGSYITTVEYYDPVTSLFTIHSNELIAEDPGWSVWGVSRAANDYTLANGKMILLAYRSLPEPAYALISYNPDNKEFEKLQEFVLTDYPLIDGGFYDMVIDKVNGFAYLLGLNSAADPVELSVISVDLNLNVAYYPEDVFTLPLGDYLFPTMAFIPGNGKVLIMGVSASPSDYFNGTNKTYLFKPEYSVAINNQLISKAPFKCYPNPTLGEFNIAINVSHPDNYLIEIVNMQGTVVYNELRQENNTGNINWKFNNLDLPAGVYNVTVNGKWLQAGSSIVITK